MNRMFYRRAVAAVFVIALTLIVNPTLARAQGSLEEWEEAELRPLMERLGAAFQGDVPSEKPFEMVVDFLKGSEGSIYAPFTVTLDPSQLSMSQLSMYLFVLPYLDPLAEAEADDDAGGPARIERPRVTSVLENPLFENATYEDLFFIDVTDAASAGGPIEIHRAFQAPGGVYDVYVLVRDSLGEDGDLDELDDSAVLMLKEQVEVPDFWNGELQTSTVILARSIAPLASILSPEDQRDNPYTIGTTQIVPKRDTVFAKDENFSLLLYVYNPQLTGQSPDVTVEFDFHRRTAAGESFFNRTNPQEFNAQTWPAGQDISPGIPSGQSVPLGSFPAGDFRLEIKITDNTAGQSLTREVNFTVGE